MASLLQHEMAADDRFASISAFLVYLGHVCFIPIATEQPRSREAGLVQKPAVSRCSIARAVRAQYGRAADQPHRAGHPGTIVSKKTNKALDKCGDKALGCFPLTFLRL
jgi:hypothetical protein